MFCAYTISFFIAKMQSQKPNIRARIYVMEDKILEIMIQMAHISAIMQSLSAELDKMYSVLADKEFIKTLQDKKEK